MANIVILINQIGDKIEKLVGKFEFNNNLHSANSLKILSKLWMMYRGV